ncbi:MAG: putative SOS response-associated peptidase YedK [Sphingobacteriales bacterium]|jgi:putative SOS response-associated peptidase YedK
MCFNISSNLTSQMKYAKRHGLDTSELDKLLAQQGELPLYHQISGFAHPALPVITSEQPEKISLSNWGLIPSWVKEPVQAMEMAKSTLNARGETIFEKPSFRNSAGKKHCVVLVNGFFEHHHAGKIKIPFHVKPKEGETLLLGGIFEEWEFENETRHTFSIVTTEGNPLMAKIHNNPKLKGPRMPVIIPEELKKEWLTQAMDLNSLQQFLETYPADELSAFPVPPILGKNGTGNSEAALQQADYPELIFEEWVREAK